MQSEAKAASNGHFQVVGRELARKYREWRKHDFILMFIKHSEHKFHIHNDKLRRDEQSCMSSSKIGMNISLQRMCSDGILLVNFM